MNKITKEPVKMRGFFRLQITEDKNGKSMIVGDSGWKENQVVNLGIQDYLIDWLVGDTDNGKSITHIYLGTGGAPASNATALEGEIVDATDSRKAVSTSIISSRTAQFTAAFASSDSFVTASKNIANIGLINTLTTAIGTLFAGNTYASSSLATNQNVRCWRHLLETIKRKLLKLLEYPAKYVCYNTMPQMA